MRPRQPFEHRWWNLLLLGLALFALGACGDDAVAPSELIDPSEIGDGSGYPGLSWWSAPSPEALGWSSEALRGASRLASDMGSGAFMVVDRGILVWEYGDTDRNWIVQSVRKSFLSALYGIYHDEGDIDLSLTLAELGIDDKPPSLSEEEKQATIEHLLQARSGVYHEAAAESQWMKDTRPPRVSHPPGTFWYYNNWDFNALGTIFTQLTGSGVFEALYTRLAVPLQMQDFHVENGHYYFEDVSIHPAYHFSMSARDMARFGLLFLRNGRWRDRQIVPEAWVAESTYPFSDAGSAWGYGYMWWVGKPEAWAGHTLYAARGGSGHTIFVVPDMEVVVVHRVDYETWGSDWLGVYDLVMRILAARDPLREE